MPLYFYYCNLNLSLNFSLNILIFVNYLNREQLMSELDELDKSDVNNLTMNYQDEEGTLLVKELDKQILTKGAWATLMFKYQDLNKQTQEFGKPKIAIRRYQKVAGSYRQKSKFNISSLEQAQKVVEILNSWID